MSDRPSTKQSIERQDEKRIVLDALNDPTCRSVLRSTLNQPKTASELAKTCDSPLSTIYRKINLLIEASLVESTYRVSSHGKHPRQYRCTVHQIPIEFLDGKTRPSTLPFLNRSSDGRDTWGS